MPGLPTRPCFYDIDLDPVTEEITGLFWARSNLNRYSNMRLCVCASTFERELNVPTALLWVVFLTPNPCLPPCLQGAWLQDQASSGSIPGLTSADTGRSLKAHFNTGGIILHIILVKPSQTSQAGSFLICLKTISVVLVEKERILSYFYQIKP